MFWLQAFLLSQMKLTVITVVPLNMMFAMSAYLNQLLFVLDVQDSLLVRYHDYTSHYMSRSEIYYEIKQ